MPWPQNIMLDLEINRVDLVDEGADDEAFIKLFKSKGGKSIMTFEEIIAKLKPEHKKIVTDHVAKVRAEVPEDTAKKLAELEAKVAKGKPDNTGDNDDEVLKNLDPAVKSIVEKARLQAKAAEDAVKKMKEAQDEKEAVAKAKQLTNLGAEEKTLTDVYKSLKGLDNTVCEQVFGLLQTANAAVAKGSLFDEVGKNRGGETASDAESAWAEIEKVAQEVSKARGLSKEAAISETIATRPELYSKYVNALD